MIRDLVTDVSWNFRSQEEHQEIQAAQARRTGRHLAHAQDDADRVQEFRKCIECFLCQDVCHVLRDHHMHDQFIGPRFLVYTAALEMHPLDTRTIVSDLRKRDRHRSLQHHEMLHQGLPESITITDNAIIPLKERVVDRYFDPLTRLFRMLVG